MLTLLTTFDPVKLSAVRAILDENSVRHAVFDSATGELLRAAIPMRIMVGEDDLTAARTALWAAGFREAGDGDWDLV